MKKLFSIIAVAFIATSFVACGPSAEDKDKAEELAKRMQDSAQKAIEAAMAAPTEAAPVDSAAAAAETATVPAEEAKH